MGTYRSDCPHIGCRTKNVTFDTSASSVNTLGFNSSAIAAGTIYNLFATCTACRRGVVFAVSLNSSIGYGDKLEALDTFVLERFITLLTVWPTPVTSSISPFVPQTVAKAILEADANCDDGRWSSASAGYRTAIERALKTLSPDVSNSLYKRIEALHGRLPKELIDLLHEVRFLGNGGAHDLDEPDREDVLLGRKFSHLFLTYIFELPAQINEAKSKRGN